MVAQVSEEMRFTWPDDDGRDIGLRLRIVARSAAIAATLIVPPDPIADIAPRLISRLGISERQSLLAAHLLAGHTLSGAANAMDISRTTANGHLNALQRRLDVETRQALMTHLLAVYQ